EIDPLRPRGDEGVELARRDVARGFRQRGAEARLRLGVTALALGDPREPRERIRPGRLALRELLERLARVLRVAAIEGRPGERRARDVVALVALDDVPQAIDGALPVAAVVRDERE